MNLFKQIIAVLLSSCVAYAAPSFDNATLHKITADNITTYEMTTSFFSMPIIKFNDSARVGTASILARDNEHNNVPDPVLEIGINMGETKGPQIWTGMELSYANDEYQKGIMRNYSEYYLSGSQSDGKNLRPWGMIWDSDNHSRFMTAGLFVSKNRGFFINNPDGTLLFSFLGTGEAQALSAYIQNTLNVRGYTALGAVASHAEFSPEGQLTLAGNARVRKMLLVPVSRLAPGAVSPSAVQRPVGATGGIKVPVLSFSNTTEQSVYIEIHAPLDIDYDPAVELHALWQPAAGWSGGNCVWKFEYLVKEETDDFTTGTPATISSDTKPAKATDMQKSIFPTKLFAYKRQVLLGRFYRDVASDDGNAAAELRCLLLEYTANKLGEAITQQ